MRTSWSAVTVVGGPAVELVVGAAGSLVTPAPVVAVAASGREVPQEADVAARTAAITTTTMGFTAPHCGPPTGVAGGHRRCWDVVPAPRRAPLVRGAGPTAAMLVAWRSGCGGVTSPRFDVDAVVNAANTSLRRGGGVCGAIFRAAGPELDRACAEIGSCRDRRRGGHARVRPAGAVGDPRGRSRCGGAAPRGSRRSSPRATGAVLEVADELGARSVAIPAISTGIYGYPAEPAARVAVSTLAEAGSRTRRRGRPGGLRRRHRAALPQAPRGP